MYCSESPDWAPTLNLGHSKLKRDATMSSYDRFERSKKRRSYKNRVEEEILTTRKHASNLEDQVQTTEKSMGEVILTAREEVSNLEDPFETMKFRDPNTIVENPLTREVCTQTDLTVLMMDNMNLELQASLKQSSDLKAELDAKTFSETTFRGDDEKTKYYTGLCNFSVLMVLFEFLKPHLSGVSKLSKFQQLLLVLMRLRLNAPVQDLQYRFGISKATVSRTFLNVLNIMNTKLSFLLKWPTREEVQKTMPLTFREHFGKKVVVIIDCFEVFIEQPSNLLARAQTWSSYKHHNTIKFLIGITPQGVISFLSKAWGGRASDKYITEHCGILEKLLPGDLVLADRGFNIAESVGLQHAQLNIPAFTKGKKQLSAVDVETTRKIAHVRIHVERVNGCVRQKYMIMQGTLPIIYMHKVDNSGLPTVDKIARVCCALTNLSDSIIPLE